MITSTHTSADEYAALDRAIDPAIQELLITAINSPLKLHLVLLFHANPRLRGNARQISARIFRDIWSTQAALRELAHSGILDVNDTTGEPVYSYRLNTAYHLLIVCLAERFDDPFMRDRMHAQLRAMTGPCYYG